MNYKNFAKFGQYKKNLAYVAMVISNNEEEIIWTESVPKLQYGINGLKMRTHYRQYELQVQNNFYNFEIYETKNNR